MDTSFSTPVTAAALIERGYREIGFVGCRIKSDYRAWQRFKGLDRSLAAAGLTRRPPIILDPPTSAALGGETLVNLLAEKPELDSIFFANDDLAVGALLRAQRDGVKIPERVAIAGFNGLGLAELVTPGLTTIASPRREIGQIAAEKLLMRIRGETSSPKRVNVGFKLIAREST